MGVTNFSPGTWASGEIPTASKLNQNIRDPWDSAQSAWTNYTTSWTSSGTNPAIGNGTLAARYHRIGKSIWWYVSIVTGSTTTYGTGRWQVTLPEPVIGRLSTTGVARDTSGSDDWMISGILSGSVCFLGLVTGPVSALTGTAPFTWAAGDTLYIGGSYETSA